MDINMLNLQYIFVVWDVYCNKPKEKEMAQHGIAWRSQNLKFTRGFNNTSRTCMELLGESINQLENECFGLVFDALSEL